MDAASVICGVRWVRTHDMALNVETLQGFFGARLQFMDRSLSQMQWLACFDGFVYWHVYWDPERQFLKIAADREPQLTPFPAAEIEGFYCDISVSPIPGVGSALHLKPIGVRHSMNYLVVTKTTGGRFSLSTTCGNPEANAEQDASANAGCSP